MQPVTRATAPVVFLAAWFGLLTALAELSVMGVQSFFLLKNVQHGQQVVWMTPLAALLVFLPVGLAMRLLGALAPRFVSLRTTALVLAFLAVLSLRWVDYRVHTAAWVVLSAGIAVVVSRAMARHPRRFLALARSSAVGMCGAVAVLILAVPFRLALLERRELAALPPASAAAPNVLLLVMDTVRAKSLSAYGYGRATTPNLERLARTGVKFERAVATSPWTLPSHASLFTGRRPFEMSADWARPLDNAHRTLAECLKAQGYRTGGFVANVAYCSRQTGLARGFVHYEDFRSSAGTLMRSSHLAALLTKRAIRLREALGGPRSLADRKTAARINQDFLNWLDQSDAERPFFGFLNYIDAHDPYVCPEPWSGMFGDRVPQSPGIIDGRRYSPEETDALRDAYDRCLAYLDAQIGRLLDELQTRGQLRNTLLIITSDHGEQFGEHGLVVHGNSLYRPLLHVPLMIAQPGRVPRATVIEEPVSLADLPATVLDLLDAADGERFPGTSLARHWNGPAAARDATGSPIVSEVRFARNNPPWCPISKGDMRSVIAGGYHYIRRGDGHEELYDFMNDPHEQRDLAGASSARDQLERCRAAWENTPGSPRVVRQSLSQRM